MDRQAFINLITNKGDRPIKLKPMSLCYERINKKINGKIDIVEFTPDIMPISLRTKRYEIIQSPFATVNFEVNPVKLNGQKQTHRSSAIKQIQTKKMYSSAIKQIQTNKMYSSSVINYDQPYQNNISPTKLSPIKSIRNTCDLPERLYKRSLTSQQKKQQAQIIKPLLNDYPDQAIDFIRKIDSKELNKFYSGISQQYDSEQISLPKQTRISKTNNKQQDQKKEIIKIKKEIYQSYTKPFNPPANITAYSYIIYQPTFSNSLLLKEKRINKKFTNSCKVHISMNSRSRVQIASLTKIMTCIVAIQLSQKYKINSLEQLIHVGKFQSNIGGTSAKICIGQVYNLEQMLHGVMLPSGNDASMAIAVWGGMVLLYSDQTNTSTVSSQEIIRIRQKYKKKECYLRFVEEMNKKCKELGLLKTSYANPHGLMNSKNKSCAYDLAVLCEYALSNKSFKKIVGTASYSCTIKSPIQSIDNKVKMNGRQQQNLILKKKAFSDEEVENGKDQDLVEEEEQDFKENIKYIDKNIFWQNTHRLLHQKPNYYIGIKTGVTPAAGPCLASCIQAHNGRLFIIIVLGCQKLISRFKETETLRKWIYQRQKIETQKQLKQTQTQKEKKLSVTQFIHEQSHI